MRNLIISKSLSLKWKNENVTVLANTLKNYSQQYNTSSDFCAQIVAQLIVRTLQFARKNNDHGNNFMIYP